MLPHEAAQGMHAENPVTRSEAARSLSRWGRAKLALLMFGAGVGTGVGLLLFYLVHFRGVILCAALACCMFLAPGCASTTIEYGTFKYTSFKDISLEGLEVTVTSPDGAVIQHIKLTKAGGDASGPASVMAGSINKLIDKLPVVPVP